MAGAALLASSGFSNTGPSVPIALDPAKLAPFSDPLPLPPIARSSGFRRSGIHPLHKASYYRIEMREFSAKLHRDLPPTRLWGYDGAFPGPTFDTRSGDELIVEWVNRLPHRHLLPIDYTLHGAGRSNPDVRTVVHLHGGKTIPSSDGYPEDWYPPGQSAVSTYPNDQDPCQLWYHDHAMGINRLNIYAGMLGLFIIRDRFEDQLNLPHGKYEIPLVICDRMLDTHGQLYYPVSPNPRSPWVSDFFGNLMTVNGKIFPYLEVEPRKYRFRLLNGSNSRVYSLSLSNKLPLTQIGTDQGLLPAPIDLDRLIIDSAERADLIIDFAGHEGAHITLTDAVTDVMQFRVARRKVRDPSSLPRALRPVPRIAEASAVRTRTLTLNEYVDQSGETVLMLLNGTYWHQPITEKPIINTTEIWNLVNLTDDVHPIHLHLVRFQVLDRRVIEPFEYQHSGRLRYLGPLTPPDPNEMGWKDTVRAEPKAVTRIIVNFEGYTGRYVWHCHNLEHEDNEMMRPYEVVASAAEAAVPAIAPNLVAADGIPLELCIGGKQVAAN
ncbi:MAG: multicopper oxidase [Candidatus Binataceae bacterium]|jgi:spore coat protein A